MPAIAAPDTRRSRTWNREDAIVELLRGRLALLGPVTAAALGAPLGLSAGDTQAALLTLESDGIVLRGSFTPGSSEEEWCDRRLLARIHRLTLNRLRAEIEPVTPAEFMRFLFAWQHVSPAQRLTGLEGLRAVVAQLDGVELAAGAWERHILPARVQGYEPSMLDLLCFSGEVAWARLSGRSGSGSRGRGAAATDPLDTGRALPAGAPSGMACSCPSRRLATSCHAMHRVLTPRSCWRCSSSAERCSCMRSHPASICRLTRSSRPWRSSWQEDT